MKIETVKEARIIADFNRGRLSAKQAARMLKKAAIRKGRKSGRAGK